MSKKLLYIYILLLALFIASCSKESKNIFSRSYHTTTARYNAYFNGNESLKSGIAQLGKSHTDDYDKVIPLFVYSTPSTVSGMSAGADVAIKKASKVINKHSINIKGKEYNSWIDENYMLLGKAQFYKMDYKSSIQTFEYVAKMGKNQKEIDPKEEKKKLKKYLLYLSKALKNNPHKWEAYLWLTRSYIENKQYDKAQTVLDLLEFDEHFPKKLQGTESALYADYYIKQDNYSPALVNLEEAISNTKKKAVRARILFATAQIYTELNNNVKAIEKYTQLLKINSISYEMEFTARINRALLYGGQEGGRDQIRKELEKMLKDKKNEDYKDQIYFALANMDQKEGNTPQAIKNYQASIKASSANKKQKAKSCIKLADIYYTQPEYKLAYAYYDSSIGLITTNYPGYDEISERKTNLTDLVKNLNIIETEDSLQGLAHMNEGQRQKFVDALVKQDMQKAVDKLALANAPPSSSDASVDVNTNPNAPAAWYFYNTNMISYGKTQFAKTWGTRKLEDNWRRSNKNSVEAFDDNSDNTTTTDSTNLVVDGKLDPKAADKLKEKYLANIPTSDDQLKVSNDKIIEAYYNIGTIYKEQFSDNKRSVQAFETLIQKYPSNKYLLPSYYQLYRTYLAMGDDANANKYRSLILGTYPESEYAKVILDPDYYKQKMAEKDHNNQLYLDAYTAFKNGNYTLALNSSISALSQIQDTALSPKFLYLKALSTGHLKPNDEFRTALTDVITQYPKNAVAKEAKTLLAYLNNPELLLASKSYDSNIQGDHYYILVVPNTYVNIKKLTDTISIYNSVKYASDSLIVTSAFLNPETQMITIKNFKGKDATMNYFNAIKGQDDLFSIIQPNKFDQFIITTSNYSILSAKKEINTYRDFFNKSYVSQ